MSDAISFQRMAIDTDEPSYRELLPPDQRERLGAADRATSPEAGLLQIENELEIRIGDRPQVYRLADLYKQGHQGAAPNPNLLPIWDEYEFWVIVHAVGAMKRHGPATIRSLGYQMSFTNGCAATVGMQPDSLSVENFTVRVALGAEGDVELPGATIPLGGGATTLAPSIRLSYSSETKLVGKLEFGVRTRVISTVGLCRSGCEWRFQRSGSKDHFGDHLIVQTIKVLPGTPSVSFTARAYAQLTDWWEWTRAPRLIWTRELTLVCSPMPPPPDPPTPGRPV
jgi:hypothetical protein